MFYAKQKVGNLVKKSNYNYVLIKINRHKNMAVTKSKWCTDYKTSTKISSCIQLDFFVFKALSHINEKLSNVSLQKLVVLFV